MARKRHLLLGNLQSILKHALLRQSLILTRIKRSRWRWLAFLAVGAVLAVGLHGLPAVARDYSGLRPLVVAQASSSGQQMYDSGRFREAAAALEAAIARYEAEGDQRQLGAALGNLALVYQQLGDWAQAEAASSRSVSTLRPLGEPALLAQALSVRGGLQLAQGQGQAALASWEEAEALYKQDGNDLGVLKSQINQAQALQELGFYRRAVGLLSDMPLGQLSAPERLLALQNLGEAQRVVGELQAAKQVLNEALVVATAQDDPEAIAQVQLSLGNLYRSLTTRIRDLGDDPNAFNNFLDSLPELPDNPASSMVEETLARYEQAVAASGDPGLQAQLYQLQRRVEDAGLQDLDSWEETQTAASALLIELESTRQSSLERSLMFYEQAIAAATKADTRLQAQLYRLQVLTQEPERWSEAKTLAAGLLSSLRQQPASRASVYRQLEYVAIIEAWRADLGAAPVDIFGAYASPQVLEDLLNQAVAQAETLDDARLQAYAIGRLGQFYEQVGRLDQAADLTADALLSAQYLNATDLAYQWHWQAGRILKRQNKRGAAIAAYEEALEDLRLLRADLTALSADAQFSFRNAVEPVHRQLVDLLLSPEAENEDLDEARRVIESLQVAELNNFFREACLDNQEVDIESVDDKAAVIYPIILPDRLEVITSLPSVEKERRLLRHTSQYESSAAVEQATSQLLQELQFSLDQSQALEIGTQLYRWIIEPIEAELAESEVETLVFVLDGNLRNVPMSALYDGEGYLVERYGIALTPGLQLFQTRAIADVELDVLLAGVSEDVDPDFPALPGVVKELEVIAQIADNQTLLNSDFTRESIQAAAADSDYPIVHLATHGQFSSEPESTFILSWRERIKVEDIGRLLQTSEVRRQQPIELLVLSACQTAAGDDQAALGLAGVAVRSGARSTVASLWNLNDEVAPQMMESFYKGLREPGITKAEALRQTQLKLINDPQLSAPVNWAPLVLVGNWQ